MPTIGTRAEWLAARTALLEQEKAHMRASDALATARRELPWVEVTEDYRFTGPAGEVGLADLFDGHSQLVVYHFMFGPDADKPCPSCSFWADHFAGPSPHLARRDVRLIAISRSPHPKLAAWAKRADWHFPWYSSFGSRFNVDYGVSFTEEPDQSYNFRPTDRSKGELPGISCFVREGDRIFHTYSAYARGVEPLNTAYHVLDLAPKGRDEQDLDWAQQWVKRLVDLREGAQ